MAVVNANNFCSVIIIAVFMAKAKNVNITRSGTILQNGMRVWVDARKMKRLTLQTGDICEF